MECRVTVDWTTELWTAKEGVLLAVTSLGSCGEGNGERGLPYAFQGKDDLLRR